MKLHCGNYSAIQFKVQKSLFSLFFFLSVCLFSGFLFSFWFFGGYLFGFLFGLVLFKCAGAAPAAAWDLPEDFAMQRLICDGGCVVMPDKRMLQLRRAPVGSHCHVLLFPSCDSSSSCCRCFARYFAWSLSVLSG